MRPPPLADLTLRLLVRRESAQAMIGDLREEFARFKLADLGPLRARIWYWNQTFWILVRFSRVRVPGLRWTGPLVEDAYVAGNAWWFGLLADLRYSTKRLWASPGFSLTTVTILALGVGVSSAVFSALNGVLLEPLPYERPEELVIVGGEIPGVGSGELKASPPEYQDFLQQATGVTELAATWPIDANLTGGRLPERVAAAVVTPNFFSLLGVTPALGRDFREEDTQGNIGYVVILSHEAWVRLFDRDPEVLGRVVRIDGDSMTVIGVMPDGFVHPGKSGVSSVELWAPIDLAGGTPFYLRGAREFTVVGRLRKGVSLEESQAEFERLAEIQEEAFPHYYPPDGSWSVRVVPLLDETIRPALPTLLILFGSVAIVFLVVSTNLATLQLTQGAARARDLAVRAAIGGSRLRIGRQLCLESLVLALVGGAAGVGVAVAGIRLFRGLASAEFPRIGNVGMDTTVLAFALGASLLSVVLFGFFPAIRLSDARPRESMGAVPGRIGAGRHLLRDASVGVQVALALVLVIGAGLLLKSFDAMGRTDLGFDPSGILTMETWLPIPNDQSHGEYVESVQRSVFFERALREMANLPGVTSAALTSLLPLRGVSGFPVRVNRTGVGAGESLATVEIRVVSDDYFEVMGIPLLAGRGFEPGDDDSSKGVVIVSQAFADRHFPGTNPLGQTIDMGASTGSDLEIVGVVGNVCHQMGNPRSRDTAYRTFRQGVSNEMTFVLKTADRPEYLAESATWALRRANPDLPGFAIASMAEVVAGARRQHRVLVTVFGVFSLLSLTLSALGIYGVVAFAVARRARELGVRVALGSARAGVLRMLLGEGLRLSLAGAAVGLGMAWGLSRVLTTVLFDVEPLDLRVFAGAAAVTVAVVTLASLIPALEATRLDPIQTIKAD